MIVRRMYRRHSLLASIPSLLALGAASCGPSTIPPATDVLGDGTRVEVAADGSLALFDGDGHALGGTAPGHGPLARTFAQRVTMLQGFYTFRRTGVTDTTFSTFEGSEFLDGSVTLRFSSPTGARARLIVRVETPDVSTSLELVVDEGVAPGDGELSYVLHQDIYYCVLTAARVLRGLCENVRGALSVVQPRVEILTAENLH